MSEFLSTTIALSLSTAIFISILLTLKSCEQSHEAIYIYQQEVCFAATKNEKCFVRLQK